MRNQGGYTGLEGFSTVPFKSTYQGIPLKEIAETAEALNQRYYENKGVMDKLEIYMDTLELLPNSESVRDNMTNYLKTVKDDIIKNGNYENASVVLSEAVKNIYKDKNLALEIKKKQKFDTWSTELYKRVGEDSSKQGILSSDYEREVERVLRSNVAGQPLELRGVPTRYNIAERYNSIIKGFQGSSEPIEFTAPDGTKTFATFDPTMREYYVTGKRDHVDRNVVENTAINMILQDPQVMEMINRDIEFELEALGDNISVDKLNNSGVTNRDLLGYYGIYKDENYLQLNTTNALSTLIDIDKDKGFLQKVYEMKRKESTIKDSIGALVERESYDRITPEYHKRDMFMAEYTHRLALERDRINKANDFTMPGFKVEIPLNNKVYPSSIDNMYSQIENITDNIPKLYKDIGIRFKNGVYKNEGDTKNKKLTYVTDKKKWMVYDDINKTYSDVKDEILVQEINTLNDQKRRLDYLEDLNKELLTSAGYTPKEISEFANSYTNVKRNLKDIMNIGGTSISIPFIVSGLLPTAAMTYSYAAGYLAVQAVKDIATRNSEKYKKYEKSLEEIGGTVYSTFRMSGDEKFNNLVKNYANVLIRNVKNGAMQDLKGNFIEPTEFIKKWENGELEINGIGKDSDRDVAILFTMKNYTGEGKSIKLEGQSDPIMVKADPIVLTNFYRGRDGKYDNEDERRFTIESIVEKVPVDMTYNNEFLNLGKTSDGFNVFISYDIPSKSYKFKIQEGIKNPVEIRTLNVNGENVPINYDMATNYLLQILK